MKIKKKILDPFSQVQITESNNKVFELSCWTLVHSIIILSIVMGLVWSLCFQLGKMEGLKKDNKNMIVFINEMKYQFADQEDRIQRLKTDVIQGQSIIAFQDTVLRDFSLKEQKRIRDSLGGRTRSPE